ncbi:MAG: heme-binding domain-containing protein [Gemmatimonadaceae bacterium]
MTTRRLTRAVTSIVAAAFAIVAHAAPAGAQGQPNMGTGPVLPKSGTIARDTAYERKVLAAMKAPDGFTMLHFAGPPFAMYPTVVAPAPDGSVYVGVDLNLAQGAVKGRGRVVRLVDSDGDGHADKYTIFSDVDSPRGIAVDANTVYVLHPPNLTAYRDTNGDGIADTSDDIVKDIGFGLDGRSEDHATNNITLGPDGWIYVAVGDYGYLDATGKDGTKITRHGGSLVRVRPDGTGLEIVTVGTRNIYDVGIDPFAHAFTRDNTNDGLGWDTRFHWLAQGANMGYPSLFLHFREEHMPSIADYGAGSGTAGLGIQDPGFPDQWNNTLYTGDWTVNRIFQHPLERKGASWAIKQNDFMTVPRAIDMAMDDQSHLYVASLIGGVFNYAGDTVGAIVRVSYPGRTPSAALRPATRTDGQLLTALVSANAVHRLWAQRELVHRGAKPATIARLQQYALDRQRTREARASAMFTLKLLAGARANATVQRIAAEPAMREFALHLLTDDKRQLAGVPVTLYVTALNDADLAVRAAAINGLVRLNARDRAESIVPLLTSPDSALAHLAVQALVSLGARDVALRALTAAGSAPELRTRARFVLQQMHDAETVSAVLAAAGSASDPAAKREIVATLARLYNTEGPWKGEWWGTHPSTVGPYFTPVTWEESARIKPVLRQTLLAQTGGDFDALVDLYAKNRVVPMGAKPLFAALATSPAAAQRDALVDALVGTSQLATSTVPLVARIDATSPALHAAVAELLAGETTFEAPTLALARTAALDSTIAGATRAKLLTALAAMPGDAGRDAATEIFARLTPRPGTPAGANDPIEAAWRSWVGQRQRAGQLDYFVDLARTAKDPAQRTLAYAVLLQSARNQRAPAAIREKVVPVLDAAWADAAAAPRLVDAITIMRVESQYTQQLEAYKAKQSVSAGSK